MKKDNERLPTSGGSERARKIWEEGRKKLPTPELVKIIEDSQNEIYLNEKNNIVRV